MGNELAELASLTSGMSKYDANTFNSLAKTTDFLPRIQLMTAKTKACGEGFPVNHIALVDGKALTDLTQSADVLLLAWRPRASDMNDGCINSFDDKSDLFKSIAERADQPESGCMFGIEFLVYVPTHKRFATIFLGSRSARGEAPVFNAIMADGPAAATIKPRKIETKKYTWFVLTATACSTPFEMPSVDIVKTELDKFLNPKDSEVKAAGSPATDRAR